MNESRRFLKIGENIKLFNGRSKVVEKGNLKGESNGFLKKKKTK